MKTHRCHRPLVFITFPYLALIVLAALLASMTLALFNKVQESRPSKNPVRDDAAAMRY
ncbi:MAG: hypothetical protein J0L73_20685 [Verrucomicrobia bacterium]|nr:hypothetical protein [Verrucomicrobiota bacterium]